MRSLTHLPSETFSTSTLGWLLSLISTLPCIANQSLQKNSIFFWQIPLTTSIFLDVHDHALIIFWGIHTWISHIHVGINNMNLNILNEVTSILPQRFQKLVLCRLEYTSIYLQFEMHVISVYWFISMFFHTVYIQPR